MEDYPLVSILMTSYNRERYISEAIESVLASTYTHFELIIVDDCSKDQTFAIAKEYEKKDQRVKVYLNQKNLGDYPNRNKAASYAKGVYIMFVDSDDKIFENGIKECVSLMKSYPQSSFGMRLFDKDCKPFLLHSAKAVHDHFFEAPFLTIGPGGTIIKRDFFEKINGYPEKYGPANDMYFNLKAVSQTDIVMIPFEFLFYRRHEGQEINNKMSYLYNNYLYLKDALTQLPLGLSKKKIKWLESKNKRRFLVNVCKYFFSTYDIKKTLLFFRITQFNLRDVSQAIFH